MKLLSRRGALRATSGLLLLAVLPLPDFWITQLNYIGLFSLVVLGLVLLTGVGGLTSFGQAAFAGVGAYAPERVLTNADLEAMMDTTDEWIRTRSGIRERRISHVGLTELAEVAARRALAEGLHEKLFAWLMLGDERNLAQAWVAGVPRYDRPTTTGGA